MDITILAAWGEFLGGIAVVVSLVYLAGQIRQNSKLLRASTASVTQQSSAASNTLIVQDSELARIYWAGMADRAELSDADRQRFDPLVAIQINGFQHHFRLERDGLVSPEIWEDQEQYMSWTAKQPGLRQWWVQWGQQVYAGAFRQHMDRLIREGEAAS